MGNPFEDTGQRTRHFYRQNAPGVVQDRVAQIENHTLPPERFDYCNKGIAPSPISIIREFSIENEIFTEQKGPVEQAKDKGWLV
jgi:hypothetical protein